MDIKKFLTNKYTILVWTAISCMIIAVLYSFGQVNLIFANFLGVFFIIVGSIISRGFFLFSVDYISFLNTPFKARILYILKSLFISEFILLPVAVILFLINSIGVIPVISINKIIGFTISYLSPLCLFFSLKITSSRNWTDTSKIVSLSIASMLFSDFLIKII